MVPSPAQLHRTARALSAGDVERDIDAMLWSMKLCFIRRYSHQKFWEKETIEAEYASRLEPFPRLESVAEHSWHVADSVMILGGHFEFLNMDRCVRLAILHDKMEITTGDKNPVGRSGMGESTHAFNQARQSQKEDAEKAAMESYLRRLRQSAADSQRELLTEIVEGRSPEARCVKAVDKLQALAFVLVKKRGVMLDKHLQFTLKYSEKVVTYFPGLEFHYDELKSRLLAQVAKQRETTVSQLEDSLYNDQLTLSLFTG